MDVASDTLLLINDVATYQVYAVQDAARYYREAQGYIESILLAEDVALMATETDLDGFCAVPSNYVPCVLGIQDAATAYNALGTLPQYPTMQKNYNALSSARRVFNTLFFPYNRSAPLRGVSRRSL